MDYQVEINGINVDAVYTEHNIKQIFLPILRYITKLHEQKKKRVLVLLAAPPGAGKSTLLSFLKYLSETKEDITPISTIGMDGFHRYQEYLLSHTLVRAGRNLKMVEVKGCPETFDLDKLSDSLKQVAAGEIIGWPEYNRMTHNPKENAIKVNGGVVLLEGNYLLLDREGWKELKEYADFTISIKADGNFLRDRLIDRKIKSGTSKEKAEAFVDFSDMYNVNTCLSESVKADVELQIMEDNSYKVLYDGKDIFENNFEA